MKVSRFARACRRCVHNPPALARGYFGGEVLITLILTSELPEIPETVTWS